MPELHQPLFATHCAGEDLKPVPAAMTPPPDRESTHRAADDEPGDDLRELRVMLIGAATPDLERAVQVLYAVAGKGLYVIPPERSAAEAGPVDLMLFDADAVLAGDEPGARLRARIEAECSRRAAPALGLASAGAAHWVRGLLGLAADDLIFKPVTPAELSYRVRRLVCGSAPARPAATAAQPSGIITVVAEAGDRSLLIAERERCVRTGGREVSLTPKEFALLALFAADAGRVFAKDEIIAALWPQASRVSADDVYQCVRHLRAKIEPDPARPFWIQTVEGFGYRLNGEVRRS